jgi:serine/threonine protein kinase/tetratricopeptide (TPR) repeat protein
MPAQPRSLKEVFLDALAIAPPERAAWLENACGGNADLRRHVELMLAAHDEPQSLIDRMAPANGPPEGATGPVVPGKDHHIDPVETETAGTKIGPYKLLEQIGEGGMGTVWMAEQTEPIHRRVAIKVVKEGMESKQVLARFEAERQALALMDHPNIARVFDAAKTPAGRPYFVMELVKGLPITRYCDEKRLGVRERLALFADVCRAVQHAHQKGVIHRDIKPSNVLVAPYDGRPVVKVIDFGVAKATGQRLTERTLFTGFGAVVGTLEYMSPEQAELNNQDIDTRSDVYSLGVLLYELLTGSTPLGRKRLKEAALLEVLRVIREEEPQKPSTRLSTTEELPTVAANRGLEPKKLSGLVRGELDWIVMKALEKDRNRRYETANGLAMDVQRYLADEAVQACPPSAWYRLRKIVRRHKRAVFATLVFVLLLLAGIVGTTTGLVRALGAERRAVTERDEKEEARRQTRQTLNTMTDAVLLDLLGRQTELTEEHREFLKKVLDYHAAFAVALGDDPDGRASRGDGYFRVGTIRHRLGELKLAESAMYDALAIRKQLVDDFPNRSDYQHDLSVSYTNLGVLLRHTGQPKKAEEAFDHALAIQKQLAAEFPIRSDFRHELARCQGELARLLGELNRPKEAEAAYDNAINITRQLANEFPSQPVFHQDLAAGLLGVVHLRFNGNRIKEAESAILEGQTVSEKLAAEFPRRPDFRAQLALAHNYRGMLHYAKGQLKETEAVWLKALATRKELVADFPSRPRFLLDLAASHNNLAALLFNTGRPQKAETAWNDALDIQKQLVAKFPTVPEYRHELANAYRNLAILHKKRGDFAAAVALLEQGLPHRQLSLRASPRNRAFRQHYRDDLTTLAGCHLSLGGHDRLATTANELARFGYDAAGDSYDAACYLCYCVRLAGKDVKLGDARRKELVESYADQAMVLLRQAVARGFKDAAHMRKETDLDPLQARHDFKKLLAELEEKGKNLQKK